MRNPQTTTRKVVQAYLDPKLLNRFDLYCKTFGMAKSRVISVLIEKLVNDAGVKKDVA